MVTVFSFAATLDITPKNVYELVCAMFVVDGISKPSNLDGIGDSLVFGTLC